MNSAEPKSKDNLRYMVTKEDVRALESRVTLSEMAISKLESSLNSGLTRIENNLEEHMRRQEELSQAHIISLKEHVVSVKELNHTIQTSHREFVSALTGKDHVPTPVVKMIVRILAFVIFGLAASIGVLITGAKSGWFDLGAKIFTQ